MPATHTTIEQIREALDALVTRASAAPDPDPTEDPADVIADHLVGNRHAPFVSVQDRTTGKFVQFAGNKSEPLVLDLPLQALTVEEQQRAGPFFSQYAVHSPEETQLYDVATGEPMGKMSSYRVEFGRDIGSAVSCALDVFHEVYGLPAELDLILDEH